MSDLYAGVERDYRNQGRNTLSTLQLRWSHLKPFFGDMQAVAITKQTIEGYIDDRLQKGAARATINRELACLKRAFKLAAERLPRLPVFPKQLREDNIRTGFVEDQEYSRLVAHAPELWLRAFCEIAYTLGWRISEILRLRVKQVDLRKRTIRLEPGTTKNKMGREGPINAKLHQLLTECVAGKAPEDFILTRGRKPVRNFRGRWKILCEQAQLPDLLIHDFRRSAARNLRTAGVAESVVMEIGGWKTASVFRQVRDRLEQR